MQDKDTVNRRKALQKIGLGFVGASVIGSQAVAAHGDRESKQNATVWECVRSFDPEDPDEVKEALGCFLQIESEDRAGDVLESLPQKRRSALLNALENGEGLVVETKHEQVNGLPNSSDGAITISSTENHSTFRSVVEVKSEIGTKEAEFQHYTSWVHDGETVSDVEFWHEVNTGGALAHWAGTTTEQKVLDPDWAMTRLAGKIEFCITRFGCFQSGTVGTANYVYPNGTANAHKL